MHDDDGLMLIFSFNGHLNKKPTCLIYFQITSLSKKNLPQLTVNTSNLEEIMSRAYDSFNVQLSNLQLLYSKPGASLMQILSLLHPGSKCIYYSPELREIWKRCF